MVSLIEQAAKRLEELRRSGAVAGADAPSEASPNVAKSGDDHVPTPEALVRALDARHVEPAAASSPPPRTADTRTVSGGDDAMTSSRPAFTEISRGSDHIQSLAYRARQLQKAVKELKDSLSQERQRE